MNSNNLISPRSTHVVSEVFHGGRAGGRPWPSQDNRQQLHEFLDVACDFLHLLRVRVQLCQRGWQVHLYNNDQVRVDQVRSNQIEVHKSKISEMKLYFKFSYSMTNWMSMETYFGEVFVDCQSVYWLYLKILKFALQEIKWYKELK